MHQNNVTDFNSFRESACSQFEEKLSFDDGVALIRKYMKVDAVLVEHFQT